MSHKQSPPIQGHAPASPPSSPDNEATTPPPRKRRRGRRVLVALLLLFVFVIGLLAAAPTIMSLSPVRGLLLAQANQRLRGAVALDNLSLSWTGSQTLNNLTLVDADKREVLRLSRVTCAKGLWSLATGGMAWDELTVESPRVVLHIDNANSVSLVDAFVQQTAAPHSQTVSGGTIPNVRGKIKIKDGAIRAVRADGRALEVNNLAFDADIQSLERITAELGMQLVGGPSLAARIDLRDMSSGGTLDMMKINGSASIKSSGPIELSALADFFDPALKLTGTATVNVNAAGDANKMATDVAIDLAGVRSAGMPANASPINVSLTGGSTRDGEQLASKLALTGDIGNANLDISYQADANAQAASRDEYLSALTTGKQIAWPRFNLTGSARIDIAKLGRALPGVLHLKAGQDITGGTLEVVKLTVAGGDSPTATCDAAIRGLSATTGGRTVSVEPITLNIDAGIEHGTGVSIRTARLQSSFAQVAASGNATALKADYRASLSRLQAEVGQIIDFGATQLAGEVAGDAVVTRVSDARMTVVSKTDATGLRYKAGGRQIDIGKGIVRQHVDVHMANGTPATLEVTQSETDLDGQVIVASKATFDVATSRLRGEVEIKRADLGYLAARAGGTTSADLRRFGGAVTGSVAIEAAGAEQPIVTTGLVRAVNITADGKPLLEGDATAKWTNVKLGPAGISADAAQLASPVCTLEARGIRMSMGTAGEAAADVSLNADLARCVSALSAWQGSAPPRISGRAAFTAQVASNAGNTAITGKGGIDDVAVGAGPNSVREKRIDLDLSATMDAAGDSLAVTKASVRSSLLTLDARGGVEQLSKSARLALHGTYNAAWDQLSAVLKELSPAAADLLTVHGTSTGEFQFNGDTHIAGASPTFRGLHGSMPITWASADVFGLALAGATLSPELRDGRLTLPAVSIKAADASVNLGASVDFAPADPYLQTPARLALLDNVPITRQVSDNLLSRINPIFLQMTRAEGRVSLVVQNVGVPLGKSIQQAGSGGGYLDLGKVRLTPGGIFGDLASIAGIDTKELIPVEFSRATFELKQGRLSYDNFKMSFPEQFDIVFRGSVGFDDTLDLIVSLPVSEALLRRAGVKAPVLAYVKQLQGLRIDVPLVGTRKNPQLDFSKVNFDNLIKDALVPKTPEQGIDAILKGLAGDKDKKDTAKPAPTKPSRPKPKPAPKGGLRKGQ